MNDPIEMQDVTPETHQTVYAVALRKGNAKWCTDGVTSNENVADDLDYWRSRGYEARLLTAQMPVETKP